MQQVRNAKAVIAIAQLANICNSEVMVITVLVMVVSLFTMLSD